MSTDSSPRTFVIAARASQLAQAQANIVLDKLQSIYTDPSDPTRPKFATSFMSTAGDKNQTQALYLVGGKALWTKELEVALKDREVDMLVHSLKDVPTTLPEGCLLGAILEREDPVDSLVVKSGKPWKSLDDLPAGSVVGTSSVRRIAQLKRKYPHLKYLDVRGNLNTRLAKLDAEDGPYEALILAKAGLVRIDLGHRITADLKPPTLLYAVSQGALGVEVRSDDEESIRLLEKLIHRETDWRCRAERACLRVLEGGCSVPVGVSSELDGAVLSLTGSVTSLNGDTHVEHNITEEIMSVQDAERIGQDLAKFLIENGAKRILDDINVDRTRRIEEAKAEDAKQ
ncbi:porphobilinogen deaminase [Coprinopsis marcescibilis]|uniref:Porphobilinogen deaminase n=1 Tax=Coprinopsis marcescibilis TaxID=230819 RepID=A0A5C3LD32_COPMA|nr:porphobilinogen deaminase [Coprinopsis marcescibilis]